MDWTCALDPTGAAVSAANATWWLIVATSGGAAATLAAVILALRQDKRRLRSDDAESTRINQAAKQAVLNTYELCCEVEASVFNLTQADSDLAWDWYAKAETHRRTLDHYLSTAIKNTVIVYQCNAAIQRLHEVRTALDHVVKGDAELQKAKGVLYSAKRRVGEEKAAVINAEVRVFDGLVVEVRKET